MSPRIDKRTAPVVGLITAALCFASCDNETKSTSQRRSVIMTDFSGQDLYEKPHTDGNTFACATCHALIEPALDGLRRPGHPIGDAYYRPSFKNGRLNSLREAVNSCRGDWMGAPPFGADDLDWKNLETFLSKQNDGKNAETLRFEIVALPKTVDGGDEVKGMKSFNGTCSVCHGANAGGTVRAPAIAGTSLSPKTIAKRVRTSGPPLSGAYDDLTGGRMPFYSQERLSDRELIDIIAFLQSSKAEEAPDVQTSPIDISLPNAQSNCDSNHTKVGQSLDFETKFHDVAGRAEIIDNCTIRFTNFTFDGQGIDVRVYTGNSGDYANGKSISIDLLGKAFSKGSAIVRLPENISLDDLDGLSIWCVPVGISFGDGTFQAP